MAYSEIIVSCISGVVLVVVALIERNASRERKRMVKEQERIDHRAAVRAQESRLAMQMQDAVLQLACVTAKKVMQQETNGDVEEAFKAAANAKREYKEFLEEVVSEQISKI